MELRPINLCASGGKSAAKAGTREIPRVHNTSMNHPKCRTVSLRMLFESAGVKT